MRAGGLWRAVAGCGELCGGFDTAWRGEAQRTGRYTEMREHAVRARWPRLTDEAQEVQRQVGKPAHAD